MSNPLTGGSPCGFLELRFRYGQPEMPGYPSNARAVAKVWTNYPDWRRIDGASCP